MKVARRIFLLGASSFTMLRFTPVRAGLHMHGVSMFNGGKSQGQSASAFLSSDFPFINLIKSGNSWQGTDSGLNNNQRIDPSWLAADGYPLASKLSISTSGLGVFIGVGIPLQASHTGNLRLVWTVTGAGGGDVVQFSLGLNSNTPISGSLSSTGNGTFSYVFTPSYVNGPSYNVNLASLGGTAHVSNMALVFDVDFTAWQNGQVFNSAFLNKIILAGFGVWRFMDWLGTNVSNATIWATRKSVGYVTYGDDEYRASLSVGVTTNSGNDYSITIPGSYAWSNPVQGNYAGGAPVDKMTMHLRFNASATFVNSAVTIVTATSRVNWTATPLVNGDPICLYADIGGSPGGTNDHITYYVINKTANDFQISLTSGGAAVTITTTGQNPGVTRLPTLNIGTGGAIPLRGSMGAALSQAVLMPSASANQVWGTVTYEATLNCWMLVGGNSTGVSAGLNNCVPIEICLSLCSQLGMHPFFSVPPLTLDPATDYPSSLAAYIQANKPSWMIPRFEAGNEIWNPVTPISLYASGKAFAYWASTNPYDWNGKAISILGQAVASVFGIGNIGVTYEMECGGKTVDGINPSAGGEDNSLGVNAWTVAGTPIQSGYTVSQAKNWISAVLIATYTSPLMRGAPAEFTNTWQYFMVNGGTISSAPAGGSAAMTNLNNFVDTLTGAAAYPNNSYWSVRYSGFKTWAAGFGVSKVHAYEGGYSPDLMSGPGASNDWNSPITGASKAAQCVLTLATTNGGDLGMSGQPGSTASGNIAIIGMCLVTTGVSGMTQLNILSGFSGGGSITFPVGSNTITMNNSFVVNQGIVFPVQPFNLAGHPLPDNISSNTPYFIVNPTGTTFQIAATKGGTPITFTSAAGASSFSIGGSWW